ncbi:stage VI sporulation protein D [Neobacillus niacini]|uniref:stage VI sporulation protein D n=1 Tax=Neobacillus niacini TaxID=86668 RepID=UPI0021CB3A1A|nr:stage VI sporulation protein D [Neobacillus niacini]MCM3765465.1 stage VI sporulation protein D [Neobacillus niacini]
MSQENQSYLRFSVEESLWFRKGQEVEELISISLDPDITIQENDQYVTIRGSLDLSGEYKSLQDENDHQGEGVASQKFVERVAEREEGTCEFSHRFPVDITIPNNRIQSVYDIDVLVESFDYSFPERSCLKLSAELTISGLYGPDKQQEPEPELELVHRSNEEGEPEEISVNPAEFQSNYQPNFLFETEARKEEEEQPKAESFPKFPTFNYQPPEDEEDTYQPQSWQFQESDQPANPQPWQFQEYNAEANQPAWGYQERSEEHKAVKVEVEEEVEVKLETVDVEYEESSSSSSPEVEHKKKKKLFGGKKKSMTLTEFFARKDEGSSQSVLKVCIVQKGDTVESLAERYDVSVQNLLRVNNLDLNQDVYEGQVLYVPKALAKK